MIPRAIQLLAGRTAQEYNRRKNRKGAFWEDRYQATAIETGEHLLEGGWTQSIASGSRSFVTDVKTQLQRAAIGRRVDRNQDRFELREVQSSYNADSGIDNSVIEMNNRWYWNENDEIS